MVTSATIDISKYVSTTDSSSANSHSDKSCGFENIFDNANKAFNAEKSTSSVSSDAQTGTVKQQEQKPETTTSADTSNQKTEDKTVDTNTNENKTVENKTKTEDLKEKTADTTSETTEAKTSTTDTTAKNEVKTANDKTDAVQQTIITNNIIEALEKSVTLTVTPNATLNTGADNKTTASDTSAPADATGAGQAIIADGQLQDLTNGLNTELPQIKLANNIANQATTNAIKGQIDPQTSTSTQPQVQTTATGDQQNIQPQDLKQQLQDVQQNAQAVLTDAGEQMKVNAEAIAPIVVSADANVKTNVNTNVSGKDDSKDILSKTALTQDILDKTNAHVVSVDANSNNTSNPNNFSNKQNAQEQAIKFSLESNNKIGNEANIKSNITSKNIANTPLPNITDPTSQLNFSKALDNVQAPPTKEITQSDLLSQINKQIDGLKDQGTTKVTIILRPENLGKISLELVNSKEGLTAKMTTDSPQVKELLDKSLNSLKDTISNQGVSVNNVSVKLNETQKQDNAFSFNEHTNQQNQQRNSHNPNQTKGSGFSFEKEMNSATESETEITESTRAEGTAAVGSNTGKVDYKV